MAPTQSATPGTMPWPADVERISEDSWVPPWIRHQHYARYEWVTQRTAGRRIIDAACGTGYGCHILMDQGAAEVHGFDLSASAIERARNSHGHERLVFSVADVCQLPVASQSYDVFVSFETIEHIEDDRAYLQEAARVLTPAGQFICSTPNRQMTNPSTSIRDRPFNPFHVREYTVGELHAILQQYFSSVSFFGQSFYSHRYGRFLCAVGKRSPMSAVRLHQARKLLGLPRERRARHVPRPLPSPYEPEFLIAVCAK